MPCKTLMALAGVQKQNLQQKQMQQQQLRQVIATLLQMLRMTAIAAASSSSTTSTVNRITIAKDTGPAVAADTAMKAAGAVVAAVTAVAVMRIVAAAILAAGAGEGLAVPMTVQMSSSSSMAGHMLGAADVAGAGAAEILCITHSVMHILQLVEVLIKVLLLTVMSSSSTMGIL
jgi:hypothetical protein